jgi:uncharacterized RDD family membrane protein YckC
LNDAGGWKEEVAARVSSYRARRKPRPPKYPSLRLNFEAPARMEAGVADTQAALAIDQGQLTGLDRRPSQTTMVAAADACTPAVASARVIEFPRFFAPPEVSPDQLAEPVPEQPRILDAPEVELAAPALGGIVLEPGEESTFDGRPGFEVPLHSAAISRRIMAAALDWLLVAASLAMFGYIFLRLASSRPPWRELVEWSALLAMALWAGYQYLLLTYSGATPGLRMLRLGLRHFDGATPSRSTRRWRALASILSGASLGLGFAWCFLDEDTLSWHDRITGTHLITLD